jgi:hypothetical protein
VLGFGVTQRMGDSAAFLSTGLSPPHRPQYLESHRGGART